MVKFSIIVPLYNMSEYVERCVESIINQGFSELELILIDDQSEDDTYGICENIKGKYKNVNIVLIENTKKGVSSARNAGLEIAKGRYIGFCDGDDTYEPGIISEVDRIFNENEDCIAVFGGIRAVKYEGERVIVVGTGHKNKHKRLAKDCIVPLLTDTGISGSCCNKFYKKEYVDNIRFDESLEYSEDIYFNEQFVNSHMDCKIYVSSNFFYNYTIRENSAVHSREKFFDEYGKIKYNIADEKILMLNGIDTRQRISIEAKIFSTTIWATYGYELTETQRQRALEDADKYFNSFMLNIFIGKPKMEIIKDIAKYLLMKVGIK